MSEPNAPQEKRVISIQSHVVSGYVGNKAATFPLQLLGWEVDQVNTVEFSNHTGYARWGGSKFDAAHLEDVFKALESNGLFRQSHLLTGYVPGADALTVVAKTVDRLRAINPNLVYVLDPVMGDDGRIYVSQSVIPIYKSLLTKATCTTPNYFEAELLTDLSIVDATSLRAALHVFHERYQIPNVIISAVRMSVGEIKRLGGAAAVDASLDDRQKLLLCAGSTRAADGQETSFGIAFPELAEHYEGVGDVFSSLVLAHFGENPSHAVSPLAHTAETAIASLQGVLRRTQEHALKLSGGRQEPLIVKNGEAPEDRVKRLRMVELRLIQSQEELLRPQLFRRAFRLL